MIVPTLGCKIDTFSVMAHATTFPALIDHYSLPSELYEYILSEAPHYSDGFTGTEARFSYNGVMLTFPAWEFMQNKDKIESYEFGYIRLYISGSGLDWLRAVNEIDLDVVLRRSRPGFKVTRVDFAFDFVNYKVEMDILTKLFNFVNNADNRTSNGRIRLEKHKGGIGYTMKNGSGERTFYLGTGTSDRLLRIYDKKLERMNANNGCFDDRTYGDPAGVESWIRIEWQLRNSPAINTLYSSTPDQDGYLSILRVIAEFYDILYAQRGTHFRPWDGYFNPSDLKALNILTINLVYKHPYKKHEEHYKRNIKMLYVHSLLFGLDSMKSDVIRFHNYLHTPLDDPDEDQHRKKIKAAVRKQLMECLDGDLYSSSHFYLDANGQICINNGIQNPQTSPNFSFSDVFDKLDPSMLIKEEK